jgi:hypothetical protein
MTRSASEGFQRRAAVITVASLVFLYLMSVTWLRWGSLLIDTFRDIRVCSDVLAGRVLYRDLFYEYGFLFPYIMVPLCRVFGVSMALFASVGAFLAAAMSVLVYRLCRVFTGTIISVSAVITFLFVFAFGCYMPHAIFNFILPYSFSTVFCVVSICVSALFLLKYLQKGRKRDLWIWSLIMIIAFCFRPDMPLAVWSCCAGAALAGRVALKVGGKGCGDLPRLMPVMLLPPFAAALIYCVFTVLTGSVDGFVASVFRHVAMILGDTGTSGSSGHYPLMMYVREMVPALGTHVLAIGAICAGVLLLWSETKVEGERSYRIFLGVVMLFAGFGVQMWILSIELVQYRCLSLLCVIGILISLVDLVRGRDPVRTMSLLMLCAVGLGVVARILLTASPFSYGFVWGVPAFVASTVLLVDIPTRIFRRISPGFSIKHFNAIMFVYFMYIAMAHWNISAKFYNQKGLRIETKVGSMICRDEPLTRRICEVSRALALKSSEDDGVVVLPEGMSINLMSGRRNPTRHSSIVPNIIRLFGEEGLIDELSVPEVKYIVLVHRVTAEQGSPLFGRTYAKRINEWMLREFKPVYRSGPYPFTTDEFGIVVFQRKVPEIADAISLRVTEHDDL